MQALLGPSGAGKSSLLDILACRKATGSISGSLLLDGRLVTRSTYSRRIAYVPQVIQAGA
jgi:ATP-binding cassette subfamily G (WHITE) protein 2